MFETPRGARRYNIGAHLFGSKGLGGSGVGAGVTTWRGAFGMRPSSPTFGAPGGPSTFGSGGTDMTALGGGQIGKRVLTPGPLPVAPVTPKPLGPGAPDTTQGRPLPGRTGTLSPDPVPENPPASDPKKDDFQTLADAFMFGLGQPVSTQDATPTVITDPNSGSGNGMNIKGILIVGGIALAAWFAWKKWGKKAVDSAAA